MNFERRPLKIYHKHGRIVKQYLLSQFLLIKEILEVL